MYKFCINSGRGLAGPNKKFAGGAGNFGFVDTSGRQHPDVLVNIEDSKIASEFISFRDDVASSMELLSDFLNFLSSIWTNLVFNTLIQYNVYYC